MDKKVLEYIKTDCFRLGIECKKINVIKLFIFNRAFRYSIFMRISKGYKDTDKKIKHKIVKILKRVFCREKTIEIPLDIEVGKGLYIGHFSGITINPKAILGDNINIHKGVTIGQENRGNRKGVPKIGSKVWIGINSTIVGNIVIGDNVLIAPNSFVNFDIPSNSIVIGNRIKNSENATEDYIINFI